MSRSPQLLLEVVPSHESLEISKPRSDFSPEIHSRAAELQHEIDELKDQNQKLRHIVYTDPLIMPQSGLCREQPFVR